MFSINADNIDYFDIVMMVLSLEEIRIEEENERAEEPVKSRQQPMVEWEDDGHHYTAEYNGKGLYTCDGKPISRETADESMQRIYALLMPTPDGV